MSKSRARRRALVQLALAASLSIASTVVCSDNGGPAGGPACEPVGAECQTQTGAAKRLCDYDANDGDDVSCVKACKTHDDCERGGSYVGDDYRYGCQPSPRGSGPGTYCYSPRVCTSSVDCPAGFTCRTFGCSGLHLEAPPVSCRGGVSTQKRCFP